MCSVLATISQVRQWVATSDDIATTKSDQLKYVLPTLKLTTKFLNLKEPASHSNEICSSEYAVLYMFHLDTSEEAHKIVHTVIGPPATVYSGDTAYHRLRYVPFTVVSS